ncbi:uncharacterized protein H6S33_012638 [Morchella sextelata]|uniref:uncharacterized protein n=1 Tax=Morchella sextelata TaxID=1174677 RepID=UPI001D048977|nr:uncharacterized protein H6S33_012638 [Morchella sextelata]KAH0610092.1 hypothetical protein H6S33_012638 [Morchella sextelata]
MQTHRSGEDSVSSELEGSTSSHASTIFTPSVRLFLSFLLFGTLIAMQFSVVVTAANDLVRDHAPIGSILFAYTLPSVLVRTLIPFIHFPELHSSPNKLLSRLFRRENKGEDDADKFYSSSTASTNSMAVEHGGSLYSSADSLTAHVNYPLRLTICILSSFFGLQLLAWADYTDYRMNRSFLQLCSHYPNTAFGGYTTGSGCAALVGAFMYTFSTSTLHFTPSGTISVIGIFPAVILLTYALLLPDPSCTSAKRALPTSRRRSSIAEESISSLPTLSKLRIARPLFWRYMAPLALVMLLENTVVQGVLPTLLFPLPFADSNGHGFLNKVFRHTRDFYPVYVTVYQFSIFIGRSSISFFRPPGTAILCLLQAIILTLQVAESLSMSSNLLDTLYGPPAVLCAVAAMGLCGGFAFSETYWRVRNGALPKGVWKELGRARGGYQLLGGSGEEDEEGERAMREFLLSAVAPPDTVAVLVASVVGMRVQGGLCAVQVAGGRVLCRHMGE